MHRAIDDAADPRRLRGRALRLLGAFALLQLVVALLVSVRARRARAVRRLARPERHPTRTFEPVELPGSAGTARLDMSGEQFLDDLVAAIDSAEQQVLVETFIWCDDTTGRRVRDALVRAADRGVQVLALWDWILSDRHLGDGFFPPPIEAYPFKPVDSITSALRPSNLLRDHRKAVVIDRSVAFVGGYNFGDEYLQWRDTHLRLEGLAAREVANAFGDFWNSHVPTFAPRIGNVGGRPWDPHVLVHRNDPSLAIFPIRGMYLEAIDRAAERVWLTNAYFVPDRAFRDTLTSAARRGVDVRVLLPARSNHPLTDVLAHGMFDELLVAGVRVFLYRDFMMHAKTAVIDDTWVTIGTANLDRWSMVGNYELNLELRSEALAAQMAELYELDLSNCDEVHLDGWRRRPLHWRASERVLRSLAPLM